MYAKRGLQMQRYICSISVFNEFLKYFKFPPVLKQAKITSLFKKGEK